MIVGNQSAGKTSLLRRLLKENISNVSSTDGVNIVTRRCKIDVENGKWIIGKGMYDDKLSQIKRALISNAEEKDTQHMRVDEAMNKKKPKRNEMSTHNKDTNDSLDEIEEITEVSSLIIPKDLMSSVLSTSIVTSPSNRYALCELWDFAGRIECYATHQVFLTSSAVYLVVADMKDDISKQGLSQCFQDSRENVDFWFDSIHCYRTEDDCSFGDHFHPPILLVFTGKDNYDKDSFRKREKELDAQMNKVLEPQSKERHLHYKVYLSNTEDRNEVFEKLQYLIYEAARRMDNWGNHIPMTWILLEHLIEMIKKNGKNFINFTDMFTLAKHGDINIQNDEDLLLFLRFQHNVGNIIFFENIPDLIILNSQWLVDSFLCFVSDRIDTYRLHNDKDWEMFTRQGKISESLITKLFESNYGGKFSGQETNLLKVMEKLDILIKINSSNNFIMPSRMPSSTFDNVCEKFGIRTKKCKKTSWLCFKFHFLPPSFFNHLTAWFIRNYNPSTVEGCIALYRGICIFDNDRSGCQKILVTMSTDTIALQVVTFSKQAVFGGMFSDIHSKVQQLITDTKERYKMNISFKLHFQCSDGCYYKDTFTYEHLISCEEFFCVKHKNVHQSEQIYSPWIKNEVKRDPDDRATNDNDPKNNPNKEGAFDQAQPSVTSNLPGSVTWRQRLSLKKSEHEDLTIYSCIIIRNTTVFTDFTNCRLIVYDTAGTFSHYIRLPYQPRYITEIDSNNVAVSCYFAKTILIIDLSTRSVTRKINTSDLCGGISFNDNKLYVDINHRCIHVMDLTSTVIRAISLPSDGIIKNIIVDKDGMVYTSNTSIHYYSLDGKTIWKFKHDNYQYLGSVTKDNEGNLYATNSYTNTVIVVSDNGKKYKELLSKSDELKSPHAIYFDKKENILLVCSLRGGKSFLFDVIMEPT